MTRIPSPGSSPSDIPSFAPLTPFAQAVDGAVPGLTGVPGRRSDIAGSGAETAPVGTVASPAGPDSAVGTPAASPSEFGFPAPRPGVPTWQSDATATEPAAGMAVGFGLPLPGAEVVEPGASATPDPLHVAGVLNPAAFGGHPGYPPGPGPRGALDTGLQEFMSPVGPVVSYTLRVNGAMHVVGGAWIGESLLSVLREHLGLPGAKDGCGQGACGTCTVLVDGAPTAACMLPAATVGDRVVTTVEGLTDQGATDAIQKALIAHGAVQCGFCVPGVVVSAHALLARIPSPDEATVRRALAGHPCRCAGPNRMVAAVCAVAAGEQAEPPASVFEPTQPDAGGAGAGGYGA